MLQHIVPISATGFKVVREFDHKIVARAAIFFLKNDLHVQPFGYLEDVFVDGDFRGWGVGRELIAEVIKLAREHGCYKIVATSRHSRFEVHKLYESFGFVDRGTEFRLDLINKPR